MIEDITASRFNQTKLRRKIQGLTRRQGLPPECGPPSALARKKGKVKAVQ